MEDSLIRVRALFPIAIVMFALAIAFRLPSCGESYWLDELHSAWTVSGSYSEVAPRAAAGNQTTVYFHALWVWARMVGTGEIAMRMSSVLATGLCAAFLCIAVARRTGRYAAGLVAGGILVADVNAIFFGCELRPYGLVTLCAALAVHSMARWLDGSVLVSDSFPSEATERRDAYWRLSMLFWICVAALVHPTSLGVLVWLLPIAFGVGWSRKRLAISKVDLLTLAIVSVTAFVLYKSSLHESWEKRDLWRAFGQATDWRQLWRAWSWWPIVFFPLLLASIAGGITWLRMPSHELPATVTPNGRSIGIGLIPGLVGFVGTGLFFAASYLELFPLWHRRYFVAALPLLAWTAGECVAYTQVQIERMVGPRHHEMESVAWGRVSLNLLGGLPALAVLLLLLWSQGTLQTICSFQPPRQLRGEAWREATEWVRDRKADGDLVWLDSQLIEAEFFRRSMEDVGELSEEQLGYLTFPLGGSYRLLPAVPVSSSEHDTWIRKHLSSLSPPPTTVWLISRAGESVQARYIERMRRWRDMKVSRQFSGRPVVVKVEFLP